MLILSTYEDVDCVEMQLFTEMVKAVDLSNFSLILDIFDAVGRVNISNERGLHHGAYAPCLLPLPPLHCFWPPMGLWSMQKLPAL